MYGDFLGLVKTLIQSRNCYFWATFGKVVATFN